MASGKAEGVFGQRFPGFVKKALLGWWSTAPVGGGLGRGRLCEGGKVRFWACADAKPGDPRAPSPWPGGDDGTGLGWWHRC